MDAEQGPMVELENRTRFVLRFVHHEMVDRGPKRPRQLVCNHERDIVLGDAADKDLPEGTVRSARCPHPMVAVSQARIDALEPENRRFLDKLIAKGDVQRRVVTG